MAHPFRRFLSLGVAAVVLVSLAACASDTTAPAESESPRTLNFCETQGTNNRC